MPARQALQHATGRVCSATKPSRALASWFVTDCQRLELAARAGRQSIGDELRLAKLVQRRRARTCPPAGVPDPTNTSRRRTLSSVFLSPTDNRWCVAISTPILTDEDAKDDQRQAPVPGRHGHDGRSGAAWSISTGEAEQFAVLVDLRDGEKGPGVILEHPLFEQLVDEHGKVPERFLNYRVNVKQLPEDKEERRNYADPLGADPREASTQALAGVVAIVGIRSGNTGWVGDRARIVRPGHRQHAGRICARLGATGCWPCVLIAAISTARVGFRDPRPVVERRDPRSPKPAERREGFHP